MPTCVTLSRFSTPALRCLPQMLIRSSITWRVAVAVDCTDSVAGTGPSTAASRGYVAAAVLAAVAALAVLALAALRLATAAAPDERCA
jgi:hypothetical protein